MSHKVFVGNVSFDVQSDELESLFGQVGEVVEVFQPTDRESGRPRGFAFVEFADAAAIEAAIERFDGFELRGRNLRVNEAEQKPARPRGGFSSGGPAPRPWANAPSRPKGSRRGVRARKRSI
jgi:RNA recognition motif-containing protein